MEQENEMIDVSVIKVEKEAASNDEAQTKKQDDASPKSPENDTKDIVINPVLLESLISMGMDKTLAAKVTAKFFYCISCRFLFINQ